MGLAELRGHLERARAALNALHDEIGTNEPTDDQSARWETLEGDVRDAQAEIDAHIAQLSDDEQRAIRDAEEAAARRQRVAAARERFAGSNVAPVRPDVDNIRYAPVHSLDVRNAIGELVRQLEGRVHDSHQQGHVEGIVRSMTDTAVARGEEDDFAARRWLRGLVARSHSEYSRAFAQYLGGRSTFSAEESRALAVGSNATGGYLVPTYLDPTLIVDYDAYPDPIRTLCADRGSIVNLLPGTGRVWNGNTVSAVSGSWDSEGDEVSDDSPSFDRVSVGIVSGQIYAAASFQAINDILGDVQADLYRLFAEERARMEGVYHHTGTTGLWTMVQAVSGCKIQTGSQGAIAVSDLNSMNQQIWNRARNSASWEMNSKFADMIQLLGTALGVNYTSNITEGARPPLKGKPWLESDYCPSATGATTPWVLLGDCAGYKIIDRPGTTVAEYVPFLYGENGRPVPQRGWRVWWEHGSGLVQPKDFKLLMNKS